MITQADITAGYKNPEWNGHGYLREREHLTDPWQRFADAVAIDAANNRKWHRDRFFRWLDSPAGRHYGDWISTVPETIVRGQHTAQEWARDSTVAQFFTPHRAAPGWTGETARSKAVEKHELTP